MADDGGHGLDLPGPGNPRWIRSRRHPAAGGGWVAAGPLARPIQRFRKLVRLALPVGGHDPDTEPDRVGRYGPRGGPDHVDRHRRSFRPLDRAPKTNDRSAARARSWPPAAERGLHPARPAPRRPAGTLLHLGTFPRSPASAPPGRRRPPLAQNAAGHRAFGRRGRPLGSGATRARLCRLGTTTLHRRNHHPGRTNRRHGRTTEAAWHPAAGRSRRLRQPAHRSPRERLRNPLRAARAKRKPAPGIPPQPWPRNRGSAGPRQRPGLAGEFGTPARPPFPAAGPSTATGRDPHGVRAPAGTTGLPLAQAQTLFGDAFVRRNLGPNGARS